MSRFLASYNPNALMMMGETAGQLVAPFTDSNYPNITRACMIKDHDLATWPFDASNNSVVASNIVTGFNQSSLAGHTLSDGSPGVVFRPWEYLVGYYYYQTVPGHPDQCLQDSSGNCLIDFMRPDAVACNAVRLNPPFTPAR